MKVLLVGNDFDYSLELIYAKYLRKLGFIVEIYGIRGKFFDIINNSLLNKIESNISNYRIYKNLNSDLIKFTQIFQPKVIFVFKGMEVLPSSLKFFRYNNILLLNFNPDNPFIFSGKGSGNNNVKNSIKIFDHHFTYNLDTLEKLRALKLSCSYLPFGHDLPSKLVNELEQVKKINKLCFLGNPDKHRVKLIKSIVNSGISIDLYGNYWANITKSWENSAVKAFGPVYGNDFWRILNKYRFQLNILRPHNIDSHNMRSYEIAAVGSIGLHPDNQEHKLMYQHGINAFLYNKNNLIETLVTIFNLSTQTVEGISKKAKDTAETKGFHYENRAKAVSEIIRGKI